MAQYMTKSFALGFGNELKVTFKIEVEIFFLNVDN